MTVNKSDIINLVSQSKKLNLSDTEYSIKKLIDYMSLNLYQGERIEIRGFGTFSLHSHQSRIARNPKTGEKVNTPEKKIIHFKMAKDLFKKMNDE